MSTVRMAGGQGGGPPRKKTLELLRASGRSLNRGAQEQIKSALDHLPSANPWHVCFAVGMSWGRLAQFDLAFVEAATSCLECYNEDDAADAAKFPMEKGGGAVKESLYGGWLAFDGLDLKGPLPVTLEGMVRAQAKWLRAVLNKKPRFIGAWNGTALFMTALFSNPALARDLIRPDVLLPIGGPITAGLNILHRANLLGRPADERDEEHSLDYGQIMLINGLFEDVRAGLADWNLLEVHSGLYMLGTRLPESRAWYP